MSDFKDRVRIYYDAEFTGLHRDTSYISIGMVSDSGAYFYAEFNDYDPRMVTDWIQENVLDKLIFNEFQDIYKIKKFRTWVSVPGEDGYTNGHNHLNMLVKGNTDFVRAHLITWLRRESDAADGKKIQFYTDCYAYDWMLLNDLICPRGDALQIPDFIDYIPIDLSTALRMKDIDPDISREEYADQASKEVLLKAYPFNTFGDNLKHNCLWDAAVCNLCFHKIETENAATAKRIWSLEAIDRAFNNMPVELQDLYKKGTWRGEQQHPAE